MTGLTHKFHSPIGVARQLLHGKSLSRTLFNLSLSKFSVNGAILEIGGKSGKNSYFNFLRISSDSTLLKTDLFASEGVVALDVEKPFALDSDSFDAVLAFHLFEHVYDLTVAPLEIYRVLKPGGRLFVSVPFIHEYHGDPNDYWRFTHKTMERLWSRSGLQCIHMEAVGEGLLTWVGTRLPSICLPPFLRPLGSTVLYLLLTPLDRLISIRPRIDGYSVPERYALDILAVFEKPLK